MKWFFGKEAGMDIFLILIFGLFVLVGLSRCTKWEHAVNDLSDIADNKAKCVKFKTEFDQIGAGTAVTPSIQQIIDDCKTIEAWK